MRSKGNEVAAKRSWPLIGAAIWLLASLSVVSSCGENDSFEEDVEFGRVIEAKTQAQKDAVNVNKPMCAVKAKLSTGVKMWDMEDYIAHVVACENNVQDFEALKAQAVAARSWVRNYFYESGINTPVRSSESHQMHECSAKPNDLIRRAVAETAGEVILNPHTNHIVMAFYVDGPFTKELDPKTCRPTTNKPCSSKNRCKVTYNQGKVGAEIRTTIGSKGEKNDRDRGTMSQNGSVCLDRAGYTYDQILRFYYGADIQLKRTPKCGNDPVVPATTDPQPSSDGAYVREERPSAPSLAEAACTTTTGAPPMHTRQEWGARKSRWIAYLVNRHASKVNKITVHHTAGTRPTDPEKIKTTLRAIQNYHMDTVTKNKGKWRNIGYHFLIDGNGEIWEGCPENELGTHTGGANSGNLGIAVMGGYALKQEKSEPYGMELSDAQKKSLTDLIRYLSKKYEFEPEFGKTVFGHRDLKKNDKGKPATTCPGENIYSQLQEIAKAAASDTVCESPEVSDNAPAIEPSRTTGYYKVRLTAIDGPYPVDTVSFNDGKTTHYASSSTGGSQGTGEPDAKECGSWESKVVVLNQNDSKTWTFDQPFLPSDKLEVVQRSVPKSASCPFTKYASSKVKVEIAGKDGTFFEVSSGAQTFNASQLTQSNGSPLNTFNNGGLVGGVSSALAGLLGTPLFKIPGLIGDFFTNLVGVVNTVVDKVKSIDFKNIFNNISIGDDFNFEFNVGEKAASLEFYVNGQLVAMDYNPNDGFSVKADVIKILGLSEVVAVIKDGAGQVIGAAKAVVNKVKEAFGFITPLKDILYGEKVNLKALITDPNVETVIYKYAGQKVCEALKSEKFSCEAVLNNLDNVAKKVEVVAEALDKAGKIVSTSKIDFLASTKGSNVAIVSPTAGQSIPQKTVLTADANDPKITHVEYYVDGQKVGESANRKSGFAVPVDIKKEKAETTEIEVRAYEEGNSKSVGSQSVKVNVAGPSGAVGNLPAPDNSHVTVGGGDASAVADRIAEEAKKAWIAGNGCFGGRDQWFQKTEVKASKKGRKNPKYKGYPRCSAPNFQSCAGSQGLCYSAVKAALTRAKVSGVNGACPTPKTATVYDRITSIGSYNGSAKDFHTMAKNNPTTFTNKFGMKDVTSTMSSPRQAKKGDIVVWDAYCSRLNNSKQPRKFGQHGHIEIIVDDNATACSDYCATVNKPTKACWHVYRPVAE